MKTLHELLAEKAMTYSDEKLQREIVRYQGLAKGPNKQLMKEKMNIMIAEMQRREATK